MSDVDLKQGDSAGTFTWTVGPPFHWLVKLTAEGKMLFNREAFPDSTAEDFAKAFVEILETHDLFKKRLQEEYDRGFESGSSIESIQVHE